VASEERAVERHPALRREDPGRPREVARPSDHFGTALVALCCRRLGLPRFALGSCGFQPGPARVVTLRRDRLAPWDDAGSA
jgi:hypothetical protein